MEEKKTDLNSIIGFFLIFLLILWMMYNNAQEQAKEKELAKTEKVQKNKVTKTVSTPVTVEEETKDSVAVAQQFQSYGAFAYSASLTNAKEQTTVLENDLVSMEISNLGGFVSSQTMKNFTQFKKDSGKNVQLVKDDNASFNLQFKGTDGKLYDTKDLWFVPTLKKDGENQVLIMRLQAGANQFLEYVYTLKPNDYMLDFQIRSQGLEQVFGKTPELIANWDMTTYRNEKSVSYENRYTEIWFEYEKGKTDYVGQGKIKEDAATDVSYIGYKQQFFTSILLTKTPFTKADFVSKNLVQDEEKDTIFTKSFSSKFPLAIANGAVNYQMQWYFGPTDYHLLKDYDKNLEQIVWLGWGIFGWINKYAFVPVFDLLIDFLPYGLSIIILTIIVRIVLSPMTYKSYLSQAKMKVIRPEVQEINEKFSKDPMKRQQETMKLYGKAGVNPMAGCLPAVLQIPVFYALFSFFPAAIALRQQSFLWADDLSSYDTILNLPFYIPFYGNHVSLFPILASIAIFFYMKMTTGDQQMSAPTQEGMPDMGKIMKVMIYISPLMMLFFFNNYSSGLSLYYFVSNAITIGIMLVIKNYIIDQDKIHAQIQENKTKPRKLNRFQQKMQEMMEQAEQAKNQKK
ncbi:MAG: membrane protein insertase YidC [Flavobacteriales bacterium]|nr:membrane protein insertase YidC [Flavobacteriales bacterium]